MAKYTSVLHQLLRHVPRDEFRAIVERHQGDKGVRKLSCWGQFVALFFGQLTGQHSLRDLLTTLDAGRSEAAASGAGSGEPLHAGRCEPQTAPGNLRGAVWLPVPALSASGSRAAFRPSGIRVYSLDATVTDLCLKVFDWAEVSQAKRGDQVTSDLGSRGAHPQLLRDDPRPGARDRGGARPALRTGQHPEL